MIRLEPIPSADLVIDRQWLVFFGEGESPAWWARFLRPGFRHVVACAWFDDQERWVYYNPARTGTVILLYRDEEFGPRLTQLLAGASLVLRVRSNRQRRTTPFGWWCTGSLKALLGVRCGALSPAALAAHLLRNGAETVAVPRAQETDDIPVWWRRTTEGRRPGSGSAARGGASPG
jgi:hypothetical protein